MKTLFGRKSQTKRPDGELENGVKVENRGLKTPGDTKTQAKRGCLRTGKHRLTKHR